MQHRFKRTLRRSAGRLARPAQVCTLPHVDPPHHGNPSPDSGLQPEPEPELSLSLSLSLSLQVQPQPLA